MVWIALIFTIPYCIIIVAIYRGLKRIVRFTPANQSSIFVSVLIPCRNEQENLPHILGDLALQRYPENLYEVIVIDDHSDDSTYDIAATFEPAGNLRVIKNAGRGKKDAIRTGVGAARGDLILATDADCRAGRGWIDTVASFSHSTGADLIVCPVTIIPERGFWGRFCELEFMSLQGVTAGSVMLGSGIMCNGANMAFGKQVWLDNRYNLHPEIASGDDVFLLHSIKKSGQAVWLESPEAMVTTRRETSVKGFLRQRSRWLSKARAYDDIFTVITGIATFTSVLFQAVTFVAACFNHTFIYIYALSVVLKSVPDWFILHNVTQRYGRQPLMKWFLPSQVIYPFYVIAVAAKAFLLPGKKSQRC